MKKHRPLVALYCLGSLVVLIAFSILTGLVVRQQRDHARAVAEALHHEDVRTALWRMETRVANLLALTTSRIAATVDMADGLSFNAFSPSANSFDPSEPPSEELKSELFAAADQAYILACEMMPRKGVLNAEGDAPSAGWIAPELNWTNPSQQNLENRGVQRSADEFDRRFEQTAPIQRSLTNVASQVEREFFVGPLAPVWDSSGPKLSLQFARRVESSSGVGHESYRLEWAEVTQLLLAEISDLFPVAKLEPIIAGDAPRTGSERAMRLAALPARLVVPPPKPAEDLPGGYIWTLGGAWLALVFALVVGGFALRAGYAYGDKHRRFTHAVTHELRTPLTTFRMYSEMLSRGMVPIASQPEYLATLERESSRLARLVDNVLRYARLDDGKHGLPHITLRCSELMERCVAELARVCASSGARLEVQDSTEHDVLLDTDPEAVLQVLSNLVENACKYGRPIRTSTADEAEPPFSIALRVSEQSGGVAIDVSDEGPGVPAAVQRSIFDPFDRGGRDSSDRAPGVGLGLALSRALARDLGGKLELLAAARGAAFRLSLPRSLRHRIRIGG